MVNEKTKNVSKKEKKETKLGLDKLKKDYAELAKKYSLPEFKELNEEFGIEKVSEFETELLLKSVRNFISEKIATYMRVVENLLNPVNAPMFVFSMVKSLDKQNREKLSEMYKRLSEIEVNLLELDLEYSEKKEAEFIKESFKIWEGVKKELISVIEVIKINKNNKPEANGKNYFS